MMTHNIVCAVTVLQPLLRKALGHESCRITIRSSAARRDAWRSPKSEGLWGVTGDRSGLQKYYFDAAVEQDRPLWQPRACRAGCRGLTDVKTLHAMMIYVTSNCSMRQHDQLRPSTIIPNWITFTSSAPSRQMGQLTCRWQSLIP
jgi:hypothetical protein